MSKQTGTIETIRKDLIALRDRELLICTRPIVSHSAQQIITKSGCYRLANYELCLKELPKSRWRRSSKHHFVDSDRLPQHLIVRTWKPGDIFQPFGMSHPMKLSDFLTNRKVPVLERATVCVLTTPDDEIVYVCGYQISEKFKIGETTRRVLRLEWKTTSETATDGPS